MEVEVTHLQCDACDYDNSAIRIDGKVRCPACGCPEDERDRIVVDESDMEEYIQDELLKEGIIVTRDDIRKIFDLEQEYLERIGLIDP